MDDHWPAAEVGPGGSSPTGRTRCRAGRPSSGGPRQAAPGSLAEESADPGVRPPRCLAEIGAGGGPAAGQPTRRPRRGGPGGTSSGSDSQERGAACGKPEPKAGGQGTAAARQERTEAASEGPGRSGRGGNRGRGSGSSGGGSEPHTGRTRWIGQLVRALGTGGGATHGPRPHPTGGPHNPPATGLRYKVATPRPRL